MDELKKYLDAAIEAALLGGEVLKKHWGKLKSIDFKSAPGDLVTDADKASEACIFEYLLRTTPDFGILGEESGFLTNGKSESADYLWVVDPLDGTTNFAHKFPFFAVSIGLVHQGEPIVGVIFNPYFQELFIASKGKGAYLNGERIEVSQTKEIKDSLLASGFAYDRREVEDNNYKEFCHLTNLTHGVRRAGAASLDLASVAAGRVDGYWERGLKHWDVAAGIIIVKEAGGVVSSYEKGPVDINSGKILATNGFIHSQLSAELMQLKNN